MTPEELDKILVEHYIEPMREMLPEWLAFNEQMMAGFERLGWVTRTEGDATGMSTFDAESRAKISEWRDGMSSGAHDVDS